MSSRLIRMWLMPFLLLGGQAMALGLGDIRLSSALNQPMRAEIALLSATPEELTNLTIQLASADTFDRYDLDRPGFLTGLDFDVVKSGRADGNFIRVTSAEPISEPFVTFLVEASWSRGRLLREYTILLDPPTFAPPPAAQATQAVTAPSRANAADAGQIQRPAPAAPATRAAVQGPAQAPSVSSPPVQAAPQNSGQVNSGQIEFDTTPGGDLQVQRGETLWSIASRVRPDSRLSVNQTMLAIYEANPQAFDGNINVMRAGASLRIPSADDVFRISRGDALVEVQRQNSAWTGEPPLAPVDTQPSLTLVPPDEEDDIGLIDDTLDVGVDDAIDDIEETVVEDLDPVDARINEIQAILDDQDALLEIPDNELAALRAELATLRGEEIPADPIDDVFVDDLQVDDAVDDVLPDDVVEDQVETAPPAVVTTPVQDEGIVATILGYLQNFWVLVGGALLVTVGILFWFMRRSANRDEEAVTGVWEALDSDDFDPESTSTEQLSALARDDDESIVVVETQQAATLAEDDFLSDTSSGMEADRTLETPAPVMPGADAASETGINKSIEDTFSSETAINLDQSDPIAEADFHMAYGLYDQAADLINGALSSDAENEGLLAKLCEIYFVWGNRDGFIDAAGRMRTVAGAESNPDWDKIVIMGQQIAGDHELFSGVSAEGATKAVDLSFEGGMDDGGALDIDFAGGPDGEVSDIIDLGTDTGQDAIAPDSGDDIDFSFGEEEVDVDASVTREMPPMEADDGTAEMPAANDDLEATAETPTVEQPFSGDATGEMPGIADVDADIPGADSTAEINLDDLGLDLGNLDETAVATDIADDDLIDELEDTAKGARLEIDAALDETGTDINELLETGRNPAIDDAAGQTGLQAALDVDEMLAATGEMPSLAEGTGEMPALGDDEATLLASLDDDGEDTDVGIDSSLLDATGQTQVLTDDIAAEMSGIIEADLSATDGNIPVADYGDDDVTHALPDDAATLIAPVNEETSEFDFAKTEALPKDVFSSDMSSDETGRMPELAGSTDLDLDLDDLTAALKVSEVGDTVNQMRDDATVEQPRINPTDVAGATGSTQALAPEELSGDLHEARTMTEVGTKLDLARAYVDMGDPGGARSILEEVLDEGDEGQKQQARQLLESLPS